MTQTGRRSPRLSSPPQMLPGFFFSFCFTVFCFIIIKNLSSLQCPSLRPPPVLPFSLPLILALSPASYVTPTLITIISATAVVPTSPPPPVASSLPLPSPRSAITTITGTTKRCHYRHHPIISLPLLPLPLPPPLTTISTTPVSATPRPLFLPLTILSNHDFHHTSIITTTVVTSQPLHHQVSLPPPFTPRHQLFRPVQKPVPGKLVPAHRLRLCLVLPPLLLVPYLTPPSISSFSSVMPMLCLSFLSPFYGILLCHPHPLLLVLIILLLHSFLTSSPFSASRSPYLHFLLLHPFLLPSSSASTSSSSSASFFIFISLLSPASSFFHFSYVFLLFCSVSSFACLLFLLTSYHIFSHPLLSVSSPIRISLSPFICLLYSLFFSFFPFICLIYHVFYLLPILMSPFLSAISYFISLPPPVSYTASVTTLPASAYVSSSCILSFFFYSPSSNSFSIFSSISPTSSSFCTFTFFTCWWEGVRFLSAAASCPEGTPAAAVTTCPSHIQLKHPSAHPPPQPHHTSDLRTGQRLQDSLFIFLLSWGFILTI